MLHFSQISFNQTGFHMPPPLNTFFKIIHDFFFFFSAKHNKKHLSKNNETRVHFFHRSLTHDGGCWIVYWPRSGRQDRLAAARWPLGDHHRGGLHQAASKVESNSNFFSFYFVEILHFLFFRGKKKKLNFTKWTNFLLWTSHTTICLNVDCAKSILSFYLFQNFSKPKSQNFLSFPEYKYLPIVYYTCIPFF